MAVTESESTKLREIDGHIVSESAAGLVRVEVSSARDFATLQAGEAVAFRPIEATMGSDRFLGTVVSSNGIGEVTLLLDRVALTLELTTEQQEVTPFSPVANTQEYGQRYF